MRDRSNQSVRRFLAATGSLLIALVMVGCATAPEVTSYVNPVSGTRTDVLAQNLLDAPGNDREMLQLNAWRVFSDRYHYKYYLEVIYYARPDVGYLDIAPGRTLTIVADNTEMTFAGLGSLNKGEEDGLPTEKARYDASADDIHRIANAQKVVVQVRGSHGLITREFGPENFEKFRKFVQQADDENI